MPLNRRHFVQATLALPLLAAHRAPAGVDWNKWFQGQLLKDFGMIGYYADDNAQLIASRAPVDIVFLGDSITEGWMDHHPAFFTPGRIDRGIGGQTSPQMIVRMMDDVVALKPKAVHIMAGTNDIAGNTGPMTPRMTEDNFVVMSDIAHRHGIKVLLASIPPAAQFPWAPTVETKAPIAEINRWLKDYAHRTGATWVDYWPVLEDANGGMKPGLASDGVHPTEAGYRAMETVIEPILRRVLGRGRRP